MKESKEPGEDGWEEKLDSGVVYYRNTGNQHSKKSYEGEKAPCFRNKWKEKTFS